MKKPNLREALKLVYAFVNPKINRTSKSSIVANCADLNSLKLVTGPKNQKIKVLRKHFEPT